MIMKFNNQKEKTEINLKELDENIWLFQLNEYKGYTDNEPAIIKSTKRQYPTIEITYEDIWDCRKNEQILREKFTKFSPKKFASEKLTSIAVSYSAKEELKKLKKGSESLESVIWRLLLEHYDRI